MLSTRAATALGAALAEYGRRVLLVDFDPQGALSADRAGGRFGLAHRHHRTPRDANGSARTLNRGPIATASASMLASVSAPVSASTLPVSGSTAAAS